jgi:NTE family protein
LNAARATPSVARDSFPSQLEGPCGLTRNGPYAMTTTIAHDDSTRSSASQIEDKPHVKIRKPVSLALQGGGSWGAYTWGVLDALLASRTVAVTQLSGTSAGALNAAIVASALGHGSTSLARRKLREFWMAVAHPALADIGRDIWGPAERHWRATIGAWLTSRHGMSPYQSNPLGINPLRELIAAHVDIDAIRSRSAPALYVTVTNVKTGLPRVISNDEMTVDVLLASACLPQLFQAVEIDGEPYWDGGYSGNPTLWPLMRGGDSRDLIVVQLTPEQATELPKHPAAIHRRIDEIVFASSLVAEMQSIAAMRAVAVRANDRTSGALDVRLHRIGPPPAELTAQGSPMERSRAWLESLHAEGRRAARRFLARDGAAIGVRETLDIAKAFADRHQPKVRVPANEATWEALANAQ